MMQFYCLSIMMNLLVGLILMFAPPLSEIDSDVDYESDDSFDDSSDNTASSAASSAASNKFFAFADDKLFRLILGVLCAFVGFIKLLPFASGSLAILGDLFPAVAGLCGGACLVIDYVEDAFGSNLPQIVETVCVDKRRFIGIACIVIAVLHFLVPQAMIF